MENKVEKKMTESIDKIIDDGLNTSNLDTLYKLVKIKHLVKEDDNMYENYGNYGGYGNYGNRAGYDNYGRRGYDMKYRGHDYIGRMSEEYGRYEEGKSRYGANEDTKRSLKYMLESMENFARMLKEDAKSQEEVEMIRQTAQRIAQM